MSLPDPLDLVGTTVSDKYEIEQVVGEGGFAIVYRAKHKVWKRAVAIKVFRTMTNLAHERREQLVNAFIQEGTLLAELSERSAAICQARDVGMLMAPDGREMPYMVLEWLEGRTLEQVLERERNAGFPPRDAREALLLLEPVAHALALAHRKGIAHRDVKPANIFILGEPRADYTVKILDFGIAKVVQDVQSMGGSFSQTQGVVSSFTPAYAAPEQFSRSYGATGPWTDVFALALIYTELVTQQPPLRGEDLTQLAFCSMDTRRRPTPRAYGANVPDAVEAVMRRALAVKVEDRFASMGEFWDGMRGAMSLDPISRPTDASFGRISQLSPQPPAMTALASQSNINLLQSTPPAAGSASGGYPVNRTMPTGPPFNGEPRKSSMGIVMGLAAGAVVLGGVGVAVGVIALRAKNTPPPMTSASATTVVSAAPPTPPPPPECPTGMARIVNGKFFMGSDDKKDEENERPAHQVTLSSYCIDMTEVTVGAYRACSVQGNCKRAPLENEWEGITARDRKIYDPLCNAKNPDAKASYPMNCIDWQLANDFCTANKKRLPTEAEWEFATRGPDGRRYPWGDDPPTSGDRLNACGKECARWGKKNNEDVGDPMYPVDDGYETTAPAGSFPKGASPFGLMDVVGNVWEWTSDWYAPYAGGPASDPKGPDTGKERSLRGGAWNGVDVAWVRPTYRFKLNPTLRSHGIGFRCASDLKISP